MAMKRLYNDHWTFTKQPLGTDLDAIRADAATWQAVELPHDWLIHDAHALYEDGEGWYRKMHRHESAPLLTGIPHERTVLRFDGAYMDSTMFVNGQVAKEWKYGYSTFEADITPFLKPGDNEILVRVVHQSPNSRWYSGAGIYRNVWLKRTPSTHLTSDGVYVTTVKQADGWHVEVETEISADAGVDSTHALAVRHTLLDANGIAVASNNFLSIVSDYSSPQLQAAPSVHETAYRISRADYAGTIHPAANPDAPILEGIRSAICAEALAAAETAKSHAADLATHIDRQSFTVAAPRLWDIDDPALYTLKTELLLNGQPIETETCTIGFRTSEFLPDRGFLLNGRVVKFFGVCEHHDLGCLGAAINWTALRRQFVKLREMGVNAIRTSHNMPAPELMELADEMGFLVVSEGFDMWERAKTEFDYARFFPQWIGADIASWVRRDRNHPSLVMWSIGNEIYDTHADARGQEVTRLLMGLVHLHDPAHHAPVTIGSNYMPWENARKCADIVKMAGYNYAERFYDAHHAEHPDWVIYGSETSSTVQSRGVYHFPLSQAILSDDDEQCSALGNSTTSWGARNSEYCILMDRDAKYSMGQFIWTGFDYIGEPTPYQTKNSYFGQIDTAGFPKDSFYLYKAAWTDWRKDPFVHVYPYWDFSPGQLIDVRVVSNAPRVELFLNGISLGTADIDVVHGDRLSGDWKIPYEPGTLRAVAYDDAGSVISECVRSSFEDATELVLQADKQEMKADGEDLIFVEISANDAQGHPVENANNRVIVSVSGAGRLVGLDNGDSTDLDSYKGVSRRLFSGKLLAVIAATHEAGEVAVTVASHGIPTKTLQLQAVAAPVREGASVALARNAETPARWLANAAEKTGYDASAHASTCDSNEIPVRKIEIRSPLGQTLNKDLPALTLEAVLHPADATWQDVEWRVTNDAGIDSWIASIEGDGRQATLTAIGDGTVRVRCATRNGAEKTRLISQLEFRITGFGETLYDPYTFIPGGLYSRSNRELPNGNDHGVATLRDGESQVGFTRLNFGDYGSDEVTLPIFAMEPGEFPIEFWEGMPGEPDSTLLLTETYTKGSIWNVYQEQTFRFPRRLKGIATLCIVVRRKVHIGGFRFTRLEKAFAQLQATDCGRVSGDTFTIAEDAILGIGNNVTLEFDGMDFGERGARQLMICGRSDLDYNTIHILFEGEDGAHRQLCEFARAEDYTERTFDLTPVTGLKKVTIIFLPGCRFDFRYFRFS